MERVRQIGQEIFDITEGNQKWQGGIPNLISKPINRKVLGAKNRFSKKTVSR